VANLNRDLGSRGVGSRNPRWGRDRPEPVPPIYRGPARPEIGSVGPA